MGMKPILFNTGMVRAILEGCKTVTRRVVKPQPKMGVRLEYDEGYGEWIYKSGCAMFHGIAKMPYEPGDILYVRETWCPQISDEYPFVYKVSVETPAAWKWRPSIHMPREAARIFLRVTNVRVERLQDIDDGGVVAEGLEIGAPFDELWDSTIKPNHRALYGWDANPWVWAIEFERISREEAQMNGRK